MSTFTHCLSTCLQRMGVRGQFQLALVGPTTIIPAPAPLQPLMTSSSLHQRYPPSSPHPSPGARRTGSSSRSGRKLQLWHWLGIERDPFLPPRQLCPSNHVTKSKSTTSSTLSSSVVRILIKYIIVGQSLLRSTIL